MVTIDMPVSPVSEISTGKGETRWLLVIRWVYSLVLVLQTMFFCRRGCGILDVKNESLESGSTDFVDEVSDLRRVAFTR